MISCGYYIWTGCTCQFYNDNLLSQLSEKEIEGHEDAMKEWLKEEVEVYKIIYSTVDSLTFNQVKEEPTATAI